ncbi:MAG: hypothetical protein GF364_05485 [Candidatus Lokiarchaeota archaeon]|nr:hypothetical protein [Candidatus Lokiarchaeota archaeon]
MKIPMVMKKLIKRFRETFSDKNVVGDYCFTNLEDLSAPLQIFILSVHHKETYIQIIILEHNELDEDEKIKIDGPFSLFGQTEELERVIHQSKYTKHYENKLLSYRKAIKSKQNSDKISASWYGSEKMAIWTWFNMQNQDVDEIFNSLYKDPKHLAMIKQRHLSKKQNKKQNKKKKKLKGFGLEINPAIWIGNIPKPTLKEKLHNTSLIRYIETIIDTTYKKKRILIKNNGFMAIIEKDKETALNYLNEIISIMMISGIDLRSGKENQLYDYQVDEDRAHESTSISGLRSGFRIQRTKEFAPITEFNLDWGVIKITKQHMLAILKKAENLTRTPLLSTFCKTLLDAYSHYQKSEYSQSFILSWSLLEQIINKKLQDFIYQRGVDKRRENKLDRWNLDTKIENLSLLLLITDQDYNDIMTLKHKRNSFIHNLNPIEKEDAENCLIQVKNFAAIMNENLLPSFKL